MKNYFERIPFIFSYQTEEVLSLPTESLDHLDTKSLAYREPDIPCNLIEEERAENGDRRQKEVDPETGLQIYTLDEVSYHDTFDDCWIILYDKVYDITQFLQEHPGGEDVLMEYAGRDATVSFRSVGHSVGALKALGDYLIGVLPDTQKIFPANSDSRWSII